MSDDLVKRLRDTPNWMREGFQDWKDNVRTYDRAPFEAADRIEELEAGNKHLRLEVAHANDTADAAIERAKELETKLAKAVEALQGLVPILCEGFEDGCGKLSRDDCAACEGYATLAELTGGKDE